MTTPLSAQRQAPFDLTDLPQLPAEARTRDGQVINPADAVWRLRSRKEGGRAKVLNWSSMDGLSDRMVHVAKFMVAARMIGYAADSTRNEHGTLRRLGAWHRAAVGPNGAPLEWSDITPELARRFLDHGIENTAHAGNDFARLRDLYRFGATTLEYGEFHLDYVLAMELIRAPGNQKGNSVRDGDPEQGYFTPPEIDLILDALGRRVGTRTHRATVWLALELGRNAAQYALLTNADLRSVKVDGDGPHRRIYQLYVRRMKKRTAEDEKLAWPISSALGDELAALQRGRPDDPLLHWIDWDDPFGGLGTAMKDWARAAGLVSPRTGRLMNLNARRFRVTLLTNAADEGASPEHLAVLADHSDLQNVMVYIDRSPNFLMRIRDKVNAIYAPLVKRFKGTFTESTATSAPDESEARVIPGIAPQLPLLDVGGIGLCGSKKLCRLAPPLTCYSCEKFIAFRDGPHQQVVYALERSMRAMGDRVALQIAGPLAAAREVVSYIAAERAEAKS